ncbi:hypothetical protein ABZ686_02515 [Streptomyces sp. NPDC006992]|uniref:hypothetical protein n=1 Tax=Streptomyces sp. NPDC006992 TaxID=3155601 RepID=UPI0033FF116B
MTPKPFSGGGEDAETQTGAGRTAGSSILDKLLGGQQTVGGKSKVPAYVNNELLERLRNTVVGMQRDSDVEEPPLSLSSFVEEAIAAAVERAEEEHNNGRPYPRRPHRNLKTGPPIRT